MILTLKNGKKIELEYSFLTLQYLEDYEGGLKKLKSDLKCKKNLLRIYSLFIYATVRSNYDEKLTLEETVKLVDVKDIPLIQKFLEENFEKQNELKKKGKKSTPHKKKKRK